MTAKTLPHPVYTRPYPMPLASMADAYRQQIGYELHRDRRLSPHCATARNRVIGLIIGTGYGRQTRGLSNKPALTTRPSMSAERKAIITRAFRSGKTNCLRVVEGNPEAGRALAKAGFAPQTIRYIMGVVNGRDPRFTGPYRMHDMLNACPAEIASDPAVITLQVAAQIQNANEADWTMQKRWYTRLDRVVWAGRF